MSEEVAALGFSTAVCGRAKRAVLSWPPGREQIHTTMVEIRPRPSRGMGGGGRAYVPACTPKLKLGTFDCVQPQ